MFVGVLDDEGENEGGDAELFKTTGICFFYSLKVYIGVINQVSPAKSRLDVDGFKVVLRTTYVTLSPTVRRC